MVYYKLVKIIIDTSGLAKFIFNVVLRHYNIPKLIITDWGLFFTAKFWSSLCYFLGIKQTLSITFHLQTNGQTKKQNSMIEVYLRVFVNWELNNRARLLPMTEFAYDNAKNVSIGHISFELNYNYYLRMSFENEANSHSRSRPTNELAEKLREL